MVLNNSNKRMFNILLSLFSMIVGYWICCVNVLVSSSSSSVVSHKGYPTTSGTDNRSNAIVGRQLISGSFSDNISPEYLKYISAENSFLSTMRSCLGAFCFDDAVSTSNNVEFFRIGLLAPQLSAGPTFLKILKKFNSNNKNMKIDLIYDMHVPPYGYGKNHGWSRIIRIARRIVPHSYGLLYHYNMISEQGIVDVPLFEAQIRQLMRWHCRLSHVAAHTAMLTIFAEDFVNNPAFELEKMLSFVGQKESRAEILEAVKYFYPLVVAELATPFPAKDIHVLKNLVPLMYYEHASTIINEEMSSSDELAKWPCTSFKSLSAQLPLSQENLAANCSAPYVKCTVPYDLRGG